MEETFDINTLQLDNLVVNSVSVHALWLENLHLTHTSSNELLCHVRSRWQIRWKQSDCIIFSILHSLYRSGMRLVSSFPLIRCMDEPRVSPWKEQNDPDVARLYADPEVIFACLTDEDDLSLCLFQQRYWNHLGSMSAWTAVIVSQSSCHRVTSFAQRSSQLLHALPCYYLLLNIIKTWNSTKM